MYLFTLIYSLSILITIKKYALSIEKYLRLMFNFLIYLMQFSAKFNKIYFS